MGGQSYRVISSAAPDELQRLADFVDGRLRELIPPGRQPPPNSLVLVALALAHELELERAKRTQIEQRAGNLLKSVLGRIDEALQEEPHEDQAAAAAVISRGSNAQRAHSNSDSSDS